MINHLIWTGHLVFGTWQSSWIKDWRWKQSSKNRRTRRFRPDISPHDDLRTWSSLDGFAHLRLAMKNMIKFYPKKISHLNHHIVFLDVSWAKAFCFRLNVVSPAILYIQDCLEQRPFMAPKAHDQPRPILQMRLGIFCRVGWMGSTIVGISCG